MCQILRLIGALECTLLTENPVDQPIQISESKREKSEGGKHSYYSSRRIKQSRSWVLMLYMEIYMEQRLEKWPSCLFKSPLKWKNFGCEVNATTMYEIKT